MLFLTNGSCEKPEQEIPTGDNTFSCFINGELFVPKGNTNVTTTPTNDGLSFYKYEDFFQANIQDYEKYYVMFNIVNWEIGTFNVSNSSGVLTDHSLNHAMVRMDGIWYLSKENSGTVTFSEASIDGNTKGIFEFTLYNENDDSDVIHVTNGQFDD